MPILSGGAILDKILTIYANVMSEYGEWPVIFHPETDDVRKNEICPVTYVSIMPIEILGEFDRLLNHIAGYLSSHGLPFVCSNIPGIPMPK